MKATLLFALLTAAPMVAAETTNLAAQAATGSKPAPEAAPGVPLVAPPLEKETPWLRPPAP